MYIHVHIYIYTHIRYTHLCTYVRIYTHIRYTHSCTYVCIYTHIRHTHLCTYCTYIYTHQHSCQLSLKMHLCPLLSPKLLYIVLQYHLRQRREILLLDSSHKPSDFTFRSYSVDFFCSSAVSPSSPICSFNARQTIYFCTANDKCPAKAVNVLQSVLFFSHIIIDRGWQLCTRHIYIIMLYLCTQ